MKKKILVTGGAGVIGFEICKQLSILKHDVVLFDLGEQIERIKTNIPKNVKTYYGSIKDVTALSNAMRNIDIVIHLAALLGVKRSENDKLMCLDININGTQNVLDSCVKNKVKKFIFASSSEVYGEPNKNPIDENFETKGKTVYAISKLAGEELCKAYNQSYNLNYTILRYFNCYGPYQSAQFVISKFIYQALNNKNIIINGDGQQERSYTYVSDTANATIKAALSNKTNKKIYNIGNDKNIINLSDLANKILELLNKKNKIKIIYKENFHFSDRSKDREIFKRICNSNLAKKTLHWKPKVTITSGIKKIIKSKKIFDRWGNYYDE